MFRLNIKKTIKHFALLFVLFLGVFLVNIPKTYAWYDTNFTTVEPDVNYGIVSEVYQNTTDGPWMFTVDVYSVGDLQIGSYDFIDGDFEDSQSAQVTYPSGTKVWLNHTTHEWTLTKPVFNADPIINGQTAFVTNIDNPMTISDILSHIQAVDNEDGDISHLIQITNNTYCPANVYPTTIGTYIIDLSVTDTAGNTATLNISVLVKDIAVPVITGTKTYNQSYTTKKDVGTILSALSVTDNYDTANLTIIVKTDNYSSTYNIIGAKTIIFSCTDSSGNEGLYTVTVNVIDNVAPVFSGPTSILKGQSQTLLLADITSDITVNDAIDQTVSFTVKTDNYTGKGHLVGTYTVLLEAVDDSGNIATYTVTVTVSDDIPPVFFVDNFFITVQQSIALTRQDIIDLLTASGQLVVTATTNITFLTNEYEGNETIPGIYAMVVTATTASTEEQYALALQVIETTDDGGIIIEPENNNVFSIIWDGIKSGWTWTKSHFKTIITVVIGIVIVSFIWAIGSTYLPFKKNYHYRRRRFRR